MATKDKFGLMLESPKHHQIVLFHKKKAHTEWLENQLKKENVGDDDYTLTSFLWKDLGENEDGDRLFSMKTVQQWVVPTTKKV